LSRGFVYICEKVPTRATLYIFSVGGGVTDGVRGGHAPAMGSRRGGRSAGGLIEKKGRVRYRDGRSAGGQVGPTGLRVVREGDTPLGHRRLAISRGRDLDRLEDRRRTHLFAHTAGAGASAHADFFITLVSTCGTLRTDPVRFATCYTDVRSVHGICSS